MQDVAEIIQSLVQEILKEMECSEIPQNVPLIEMGFDSLRFIGLVVEVENRFEMEFPIEKLVSSITIGEICDVVRTR
ncbi:MAG: acyl carrier protein [Paenibacillaceae bacterium]|nr:acyl carrier protein [Paenibacillaceae bacterium]